ncbi:uncharacterized protein RCC_09547 [Ramularia collo-cygni]|uniref:Uncharacterized protein n=1 Tax=Ramularia collo-cygni TaxID=112498 RepID=A0A2D3V770_9PEZI|nr:uncharacterized protein RCC_09547 [Ramularia collo-cygni]CZT23833.1 uncharacterized protein RCC_09547 [Ramularia collo-cygni]
MAAAAVPRWKPNKDEQADLDAMNTAVARIKRHTPSDPYFLEIPQENGARYNHHPSQRYQWTRDTPFARNEKESLQYQTFHLYEQGKEMFEQHSTRLDEPVSIRQAGVRTGTPSTAPKTKISLAAYKKKQNAATATPELKAQKAGDVPGKQAAVKGPVERAKAETEEMLAAIAEAEPEAPQAQKKESQAPGKDLKRKREELEEYQRDGERGLAAAKRDVGPAAKKAKPVENEPTEGTVVQDTQQREPQRKLGAAATTHNIAVPSQSKADEKKLPPRLSPTMSPLLPARLSPLEESSAMSLPPRLTPTMPLNISKTLEDDVDVPSASQSSLPPAAEVEFQEDSKKNTSSKDTTKRKSPLPPRNGFRTASDSLAVRSEVTEKLLDATPKAQVPSKDGEVAAPKLEKTKAYNPGVSPILQKPRLLLKLKYRKSQASAIKRILNMRVAPYKNVPASNLDVSQSSANELRPASNEKAKEESKSGNDNVKGVAQKVGPAKKDRTTEKQPVAEKRPPMEKPSISNSAKQNPADKRPVAEKPPAIEKRKLPEEERHEPSAKRLKDEAAAARKGPSTPAQQVVESPSTAKAQLQATPSARNNLLAVAMARDRSQDSNSTQTPPAAADTPSTSTTSQPNGIARHASSQPSSKTAKEQAWAAEARQFGKLGKELKHAASAHQSNRMNGGTVSVIDQKLAAVKSIESFLSFMVGFCCGDEAGQAAEPRPHPPEIRNWQSLQGFQGFVKRNAEPFPALSGLTASLSVVFAQRALEIATQYHREDGISRPEIFMMQALLTKSAAEADAKLDVDILTDSFPKSWSQRARKNPPVKEKLEVGKLGGQYKLPIGLATSPIRAARAGCALLREWLDAEKINYSLKLKLD